MKIEVDLWEAFYWAAQERNFRRAADKLKIGAPVFSRRIAELEEILGVRLFQRSTRKIALTQDGQGLLPHVSSFLEDARSLEDRFTQRNQVSGTIRLTCVTAFAHRILAELTAKFCDLHPDISFELEITDRYVDLLDAQMDLAIRVQEPTGADCVFKKLLRNDLVLCASPKYLRTTRMPLKKPGDLRQHPILSLQVYDRCQFKGHDLSVGALNSSQRIHAESGLFLTQLALEGAGIAVRSLWDVSPLIKSGKLVRVLEKYPLDSFGDMYIVIPTRRLLAYRVRAFVDFLSSEIKSRKHSL